MSRPISFKLSCFLFVAFISTIYVIRTVSPGSPITNLTSLQPSRLSQVQEVCGDLQVKDEFSHDQIRKANSTNMFLKGLRGRNRIIDNYIFGTQSENDFLRSYSMSLEPIAIFGASMFLIGFVSMFCLCCNLNCCKKCVSPKSLTHYCLIIFSIIGSALMVGVSIFGFYVASGMHQDYKETVCMGANMVGDVSTGNKDLKWIGLISAIETLTDIKGEVEEVIELLPDVNEAHQDLTDFYNQMGSDIQTFYTSNKDAIVRNSDPTKNPIQPDFIKALGPPSVSETVTGAIKQEIDKKYEFLDEGLTQAGDVIKDLKEQSSSITSEIQSVIYSASETNDGLSRFLDDYIKVSKEGDKWHKNTTYGILGFFGLSILVSSLFFLGAILPCKTGFSFRVLKCTRLCCLNIVLLLIFALSTAIFTASVVSMEVCNAVNEVANNEEAFYAFSNKTRARPDDTKLVHTCFFEDGDVLKHFDVNTQLEEFKTLFNKVQNFTDFNVSMPDSFTLPLIYAQIDLFSSGKLPVTASVVEDLINLNSYTNRDSSFDLYGCSESDDTWFLNSNNCSESSGYVWKSTDPAGYNYGSATCMPFDEYSTNLPSDRYSGKYASCPPQKGVSYAGHVMSLVGGLQGHLSDVATVFGKVEGDLSSTNKTNEKFMNEAKGLIAPLIEIDHRVMDLLDLVGNNETGLIANLNCKFVKVNSQNAIDHLCIAYVPDLFLISVAILAIATLAIVIMFPVFFLEKVLEGELKEKERRKLEDMLHQNQQEHLLMLRQY